MQNNKLSGQVEGGASTAAALAAIGAQARRLTSFVPAIGSQACCSASPHEQRQRVENLPAGDEGLSFPLVPE